MKKNFTNNECINTVIKHFKVQNLLIILFMLFSVQSIAQIDTINVPSDVPPGEGNLNDSVTAHIGNLSNIVFELEPYGYYVLKDSIVVPEGEHLTIVAPEPGSTQETAPPQINLSPMFGFYAKYFLIVFGDLTLKNIWILYDNADIYQNGATISFIRDLQNVDRQYGNFEGVIFDYSKITQNASGAICVETNKFVGTFKNCYWKNCVDDIHRWWGRAVSFPPVPGVYHIDSLVFENCTFANLGFVYSQYKEQYSDFAKFNHCTFLNVVVYPLESGWWNKLAVTNSIFVNTYMFGDIPHYSGNEPYGGTIRIDSISTFGFVVPFTEQDRRILYANNNYFIEDWLSDWMENSPNSQFLREYNRIDEIPIPQPMLSPVTLEFFESNDFPYMNKANLYDSTNPGFVYTPTNLEAIQEFLECMWCCGCGSNWAWKPENSFNRLWPMEEDLSYTNQTLLQAGMGHFPLGDLYHWFPDKYLKWKEQEESEHDRINTWLNTGIDPSPDAVEELPGTFPSEYSLSQNYPNPFNPITQIKYSVPEGGNVLLKVYNLLGEDIQTLLDGEQQAGIYVVTFDGTGLASGMYLCTLKANDFVETKKLVLLK